jgi:hypothetical protein
MKISERAALASIFGLLIGSGFVVSRAALAKDGANIAVEAASTKPVAPLVSGVLNSVIQLSAAESRKEKTNCEASHLYTSHDVVGDPQTCIMNRLVFGSGAAP